MKSLMGLTPDPSSFARHMTLSEHCLKIILYVIWWDGGLEKQAASSGSFRNQISRFNSDGEHAGCEYCLGIERAYFMPVVRAIFIEFKLAGYVYLS